MPVREKPRRPAVVLLLLALALGSACALSLSGEEPPPADSTEIAGIDDQEFVGGEEVLDEERDEFGKPRQGAEGTLGEMLVVASYVGMIAAGILLPLFAL